MADRGPVCDCVDSLIILRFKVCFAVCSMATGCTVGVERGVSGCGTSPLGEKCSHWMATTKKWWVHWLDLFLPHHLYSSPPLASSSLL